MELNNKESKNEIIILSIIFQWFWLHQKENLSLCYCGFNPANLWSSPFLTKRGQSSGLESLLPSNISSYNLIKMLWFYCNLFLPFGSIYGMNTGFQFSKNKYSG